MSTGGHILWLAQHAGVSGEPDTCGEERQEPGIASERASSQGLGGEKDEDGSHHQLVSDRVQEGAKGSVRALLTGAPRPASANWTAEGVASACTHLEASRAEFAFRGATARSSHAFLPLNWQMQSKTTLLQQTQHGKGTSSAGGTNPNKRRNHASA